MAVSCFTDRKLRRDAKSSVAEGLFGRSLGCVLISCPLVSPASSIPGQPAHVLSPGAPVFTDLTASPFTGCH